MAQQVIVSIVDDVDRPNVRLSVMLRPGTGRFDLVLPAGDTARLRAAVEPFVTAARRHHDRPAPAPRRPPRRLDPQQARAIREWARAEGYRVSRLGRIPNALIDAYEQATGEAAEA